MVSGQRRPNLLLDGDPAQAIGQVTIDGELSNEVRDFEYFYTPPEVCSRLLDCIDLSEGDMVLEPSRGESHIIGEILKKEPGIEIHAFEVQDSAALASSST